MTQMIRKQIYIGRTQQLLLARLAEARGLSESEVIRQAIEHEASGGHTYDTAPGTRSLDQIIEFALSRARLASRASPCTGSVRMLILSGWNAMSNRMIARPERGEPARQDRAIQVLRALEENASGRLSVQCLSEFAAVVTRRLRPTMSLADTIAQTDNSHSRPISFSVCKSSS